MKFTRRRVVVAATTSALPQAWPCSPVRRMPTTSRCAASRATGRHRASRVIFGMLGEALTDVARALGVFWNDVWNRHDTGEERARVSAVADRSATALTAVDGVDVSKPRRLEDARALLLDSVRHELHGPLTVI